MPQSNSSTLANDCANSLASVLIGKCRFLEQASDLELKGCAHLWSLSVFVCPFSLCLCLSLSRCPSLSVPVSVFPFLPVCLSVCLPQCVCLFLYSLCFCLLSGIDVMVDYMLKTSYVCVSHCLSFTCSWLCVCLSVCLPASLLLSPPLSLSCIHVCPWTKLIPMFLHISNNSV